MVDVGRSHRTRPDGQCNRIWANGNLAGATDWKQLRKEIRSWKLKLYGGAIAEICEIDVAKPAIVKGSIDDLSAARRD